MPLHGGHLLLPGCQHLVERVSADGRPGGSRRGLKLGIGAGEGHVFSYRRKKNTTCTFAVIQIIYTSVCLVFSSLSSMSFQELLSFKKDESVQN